MSDPRHPIDGGASGPARHPGDPDFVPECEACEEREPELFLVGGDRYLCRECAEEYLEGVSNDGAVDAFAALMKETQEIMDALDPKKNQWPYLRACITKGQGAVKALKE